jgi:L-aspartate oxidase
MTVLAALESQVVPEFPRQTDFIVVGGGVAGLRAAIEIAPHARVCVITKETLTESNTQYAQGGVAVALSDEDEVGLHLQDTIAAGHGIVNEAAAKVLVEEGPARIEELIAWGTQFDRDGTRLTFTREGAHSRSRVLHAGGDSTGREMGRALAAKAATLKNITFVTHLFTKDLVQQDGVVCGVEVINGDNSIGRIFARAVLLATGGAGQVYSETTNPSVATGDGIAMAFRASATISDMEFMQFHPTALALEGAPRFLISEAVRGEGAYLVNERGERFMKDVDARAELAPRDVVARAIVAQTKRGGSTYLDLSHIPAQHIKMRFPRILEVCAKYGLDITRDKIPVLPAAHYLMGGVKTDLDGKTTCEGLFAAGETACTGVHGANRLASNSLLEGLVFGARAGAAMLNAAQLSSTNVSPVKRKEVAPVDASLAQRIQKIMWHDAGVERNGPGLQSALNEIATVRARLEVSASDRASGETLNICQCAEMIVRSALSREESRGAHYRTDFPRHDDGRFRAHSVMRHGEVAFEPTSR